MLAEQTHVMRQVHCTPHYLWFTMGTEYTTQLILIFFILGYSFTY